MRFINGVKEVDYVGIGRRIRAARLALNLTQEKLSEQVDVSASFIGHIERAEKVPSVETMVRLARALNVSLDYMICGVHLRCDREDCYLYGDIRRLLESYGFREKEQ